MLPIIIGAGVTAVTWPSKGKRAIVTGLKTAVWIYVIAFAINFGVSQL